MDFLSYNFLRPVFDVRTQAFAAVDITSFRRDDDGRGQEQVIERGLIASPTIPWTSFQHAGSLPHEELADVLIASPSRIFDLGRLARISPGDHPQLSALARSGVRFAIRLEGTSSLERVSLATFAFSIVDMRGDRDELSLLIEQIKNGGAQVLAVGVNSLRDFDFAKSNGVDWSIGSFWPQKDFRATSHSSAQKVRLLEIFSLVESDAETKEISTLLRADTSLSYNLLRMVNSVAVGAQAKISSFNHAIQILGRRQLKRWLQLLLFANNGGSLAHCNPLMFAAAARGRKMELFSKHVASVSRDANIEDKAFMVGMFSLLDVLLDRPIKQIISNLSLDDDVTSALVRGEEGGGVLGRLLYAVRISESEEPEEAIPVFRALGIDQKTLLDTQVQSVQWAFDIQADA